MACAAAAGATQTNTVITSRILDFDYQRYIAVFEGDVVVVDPRIRIESDKLTVLFDKGNEIKSATAVGDVHLYHEDKTATCRKAIYLAKSGEVLLTGDARLVRGQDSVTGTKITFWLNEDRVTCQPGRLTIFPRSDEGEGDGAGDGAQPPGGASAPSASP
jgi:lipopolysaccharide export system protein LptA